MELRQKLDQIFIGFTDKDEHKILSSSKYPEKILSTVNIVEEKYGKRGLGRQAVEEDEEEEEEKRNQKATRIICITIRKNLKVKIHKLKQERSGIKVVKTWSLDEIKSLESVGEDSVVVSIGKSYKWSFEDELKMQEFVFILINFSEKYLKKQPKLININKDHIMQQLKRKNDKENSMGGDLDNLDDLHESKQQQNLQQESNDDHDQNSMDERRDFTVQIRELDLEQVLNEVQWQCNKDTHDLETILYTKVQELETLNVDAMIKSGSVANALVGQIDQTMRELDTIERQLSHYTLLLDGMGADVYQVELQNKSLQVAVANQTTLQTELEGLLTRLKFPAYLTETLLHEPLEFTDGIFQCQEATEKLIKFIGSQFEELHGMTAIRERTNLVQQYGQQFASRLYDHLTQLIRTTIHEFQADETRVSRKGSLKIYGHESLEEKLFKFKKLICWLKEFDSGKHLDLSKFYVKEMERLYARDISLFLIQLKQSHMSPAGNAGKKEDFFLFTNLASTLNNPTLLLKRETSLITKSPQRKHAKNPQLERIQDSKNDSLTSLHLEIDEKLGMVQVFQKALSITLPLMLREENFILDLFSLVEIEEKNPNLYSDWRADLDSINYITQDKIDLKVAQRIQMFMHQMFSTARDDIFTTWQEVIKADITFSFGLLVECEVFIERFEGCELQTQLLNDLWLMSREKFEKFIQDQLSSIHDMKLKRKAGILPAFATFPKFVDNLSSWLVDGCFKSSQLFILALQSLIKALFQLLDPITDTINANVTSDEALTVHILNIEMSSRNIKGIEALVLQSKEIYQQHLTSYCRLVIRKPLGKLVDFFEGVQEVMRTRDPTEVQFHLAFNKRALRELLKKQEDKQMKKAMESLSKRVQKHFTHDSGHISDVINVVWDGIKLELSNRLQSFEELITLCYPGTQLGLEFSIAQLIFYLGQEESLNLLKSQG